MNDWTVYERIAFALFIFVMGIIVGFSWERNHD
jgi:hypothetical protein